MKRIGIITFFRPLNYGAALQAHALTQVVHKITGCDTELIDYRQPRVEYYRRWFRANEYVALLKRPIPMLKRMASDMIFAKKYIRQRHAFDSFVENHMSTSSQTYHCAGDLETDCQNYDCYIVGSDLVWNPEMAEGVNPVYFHGYVKGKARKIAYAPSIGMTCIDKTFIDKYRDQLKNLDYISVREASAKELLRPLTEKNISVVVDPTLLTTASDWANLIKSEVELPNQYIVAFMLEYSDLLINTVKDVADAKGLPIVCFDIRNYYGVRQSYRRFDAGPDEFLTIMSRADIVITNSFHGCIFSILFRRDLWCIPHTTRGTRMLELLSALGISGRIVTGRRDIEQAMPINYDDVDERLSKLKADSLEFLSTALGE